MKSEQILVYAIVASLAAWIPVTAAFAITIDFTEGEGYVAGNLGGQQTWSAQGQWQVDPTGAGTVNTTFGAFIRGQFGGEQSPNEVGNVLEMSTTFTLDGNFGLRNNAPAFNFQRGAFVVGLSGNPDQADPPVGLSTGIYLAPGETNLEFWVNGPDSAVDLGAGGDYDGHTWVLSATFTKTSETEYSVDATLDSLDDEAEPFSLSKTLQAPGEPTDSVVPLQGVIQTLPAGAPGGPDVNYYDGVTVDSVTITATPRIEVQGDFDGDLDVDGADFLIYQREALGPDALESFLSNYGTQPPAEISAVPEPATLGLLCLAVTGMTIRRKRG